MGDSMHDVPALRVGFILEGVTDQETIPVLVAKLIQHPIDSIPIHKETGGFDDFKRRKRVGDPEFKRSWGIFKSYIIALLIEGVDAIVVVVDNDSDDPTYRRWCLLGRSLPFNGYPIQLVDVSDLAEHCDQIYLAMGILEERIGKAYQEGSIPVIIGVAVEMLEAWLLAQPHIVESVLWEPIPLERRTQCDNPEQIVHPKKEIIRPNNGGNDLSREQARQIAKHPDFSPGPVETACPSFARFAEDVRVLSIRVQKRSAAQP